MATIRRRRAAKKNIRKSQSRFRGMTKRQHSRAQSKGRARMRPGSGGGGNYYRIEVRPNTKFVKYRIQDVGRSGHTKRLAGRRASGRWDTKSWLIHKKDAHVKRGTLIIDAVKAKTISRSIRGPIRHLKGDIFQAKPRRKIPEGEKPTSAQRRAYLKNIKKAQRTRRH